MEQDSIKELVTKLWKDQLKLTGNDQDLAHIYTEHVLKHLGLASHEYDRAATILMNLKDGRDE